MSAVKKDDVHTTDEKLPSIKTAPATIQPPMWRRSGSVAIKKLHQLGYENTISKDVNDYDVPEGRFAMNCGEGGPLIFLPEQYEEGYVCPQDRIKPRSWLDLMCTPIYLAVKLVAVLLTDVAMCIPSAVKIGKSVKQT